MLQQFLLSLEDDDDEEERGKREVIAKTLLNFLTSLKEDHFANVSKEEIKEKYTADLKYPSDDWHVIKAVHVSQLVDREELKARFPPVFVPLRDCCRQAFSVCFFDNFFVFSPTLV